MITLVWSGPTKSRSKFTKNNYELDAYRKNMERENKKNLVERSGVSDEGQKCTSG
jgi:hypothetical protein